MRGCHGWLAACDSRYEWTMAKVDVAIVGAGFSGLCAARVLRAAGKNVVVLEARDRVGGRIHTVTHATGAPVDLGGQWVGPQQKNIRALAAELGVETFPTYTSGDNVLCFRGRLSRFGGVVPPLRGAPGRHVDAALAKLDALAKTVNPKAPWKTKDAKRLDGMTARSWLDLHVKDKAAHDIVAITLESVYASDPDDLSLLHALFYIRAAGGMGPLLATEGGAQQDRFVGGAQRVADALAARIGGVRTHTPVRRITHEGGGVRLWGDGFEVDARRAIIAVPPTLAARIACDPPLPGTKDQLWQRFPMGSVIKCFAIYESPWWRERGLSGHAISDVGPVQAVFDATPASGIPGILMGFFEGHEARTWAFAGEAARKKVLLSCFARYFGPRARTAIDVVEKDWADDPWARGGYVAFLPPGAWTNFGPAWRDPVRNLHFAGTETSSKWFGYMEGAILAGERAAHEVLAALA
jgi:monoamine oxidase